MGGKGVIEEPDSGEGFRREACQCRSATVESEVEGLNNELQNKCRNEWSDDKKPRNSAEPADFGDAERNGMREVEKKPVLAFD